MPPQRPTPHPGRTDLQKDLWSDKNRVGPPPTRREELEKKRQENANKWIYENMGNSEKPPNRR